MSDATFFALVLILIVFAVRNHDHKKLWRASEKRRKDVEEQLEAVNQENDRLFSAWCSSRFKRGEDWPEEIS